MHSIRVLIVDDDSDYRIVINRELTKSGFHVQESPDGKDIESVLGKDDFDVVLLDIKMPGADGMELLETIKRVSPDTEVVMITGHGTVHNAVASMKKGAFDFITKPCELDELEITIKRAYDNRILRKENSLLRQELDRHDEFSEFTGNSEALRTVLEMVGRVAPSDAPVLIQGESGVGKELVARAIHKNSNRNKNSFVAIDCGLLSENLLISELFGHEKGAYTGAVSLKHGLFEVADGGTIFLDEIGEMPPTVQGKLLRVLETNTFRRLGSTKEIRANVRFISATNKNLKQEVKDGNFREDLFFRLNVVIIDVPPLRERKEDIPPLAGSILARLNQNSHRSLTIEPEALEVLKEYDWPGNVRELENIIERAVILAKGDTITPRDIPVTRSLQERLISSHDEGFFSLRELEDFYIKKVMADTGGNQKKTAEILKIDPKTLYRRLKKQD